MKQSILNRQSSILCLLFCALFCSLTGCDQVNSIDPDQVQSIAQDVNEMSARVDIYQQVATAAIEQLRDQNQIDPNVAKKVLAANDDVNQFQSIVRSVTAGLQSAEYSGGAGLVTIIEGAQAANAASAPWNPYAAVIAAALTILSTILGIKFKQKAAEAKSEREKAEASGLKYQAHKQGVEKTMKQTSVSDVAEVKKVEAVLFDNIGEARANLGVT